MKTVFFMDVDTQKDFMLSSGALYVPGAEKIIPQLVRLFELARQREINVISSVDAHSPDDPEFDQFPSHCVKGTDGQKKLVESLLRRPLVLENKPIDHNIVQAVQRFQQIIIQKQAFDVFTNPVTEKLLRALPTHAVVFGVATDYCVCSAALGLQSRGVKTALLTDVVRPVAANTGKQALGEMQRAGVELITTDQLLETYAN